MNPTFRSLLIALLSVAAVIMLGGAGLYWLGEGRWRLGEALYMAVISVSTVGFSELPGIDHVHGARALTVIIILTGLCTVAYFQSSLTALIVEGVIAHAWRRNRMEKKIQTLSKHVVVAGVGSTGRYVVEELVLTGTPFVVIDLQREHLDRISEELTAGKMLFICGDATEDHTLLAAGVDRACGVVAALTHDKDNLFVTLSARSLNMQARIVSKVVEPEAIAKMTRAGANATVSPNIIGGRRMASELIRPEVVEFLDQMLRDKDKNLRIEEVTIPDNSSYVGHALRDVPIRRETNVLVVALRDKERNFQYNPGPDQILTASAMLIVLGESSHVQALRKLIARSAQTSLTPTPLPPLSHAPLSPSPSRARGERRYLSEMKFPLAPRGRGGQGVRTLRVRSWGWRLRPSAHDPRA